MLRQTPICLAIAVASLLTVSCATAVRVGSDEDVILRPTTKSGHDVGLIWVEGAGLSATQYQPIAQETQAAAAKLGIRLWVGIPQCALSICEPLVIGNDVARAYNSLTAAGLSRSATMFAAAHSAGGVFLDMLIANPPSGYPVKFSGVVLMGSFILRKDSKSWNYPVLQIAAELDGLCRITRMAQSWELQLGQRGGLNSASATKNFPVGVIPGGSHMTFASGTPPLLVKERDLKPTISTQDAHTQIVTHITNWLAIQVGGRGDGAISDVVVSQATSSMSSWLSSSYKTYFKPILDAFEEEGFYDLKPPCNCENSCSNIPPGFIPCGSDPFGKVNLNPCFPQDVNPSCRAGSKWAPQIQQAISTCYADEPSSDCNMEGFTVDVSCAFHPVSQTHPHSNLPYIFNNCTSPRGCKLKANIVADNSYDFDPLDTGFFQQSAKNIAIKMKSRQWSRMQAGYTDVSYDGSDGNSLGLCQRANKLALAWAVKRISGSQQLSYYNQIGQKLVWGPDTTTWGGPDFIDASLGFKYDNSQGTATVSSPSLVTDYNFIIASSRAMHYCKVMSPAMALEWMLVDGLRLRGSLS